MDLDGYRIRLEPYYQAIGDEVAVFEAAYVSRLPVMLKAAAGGGGKGLRLVLRPQDLLAAAAQATYAIPTDQPCGPRRPVRGASLGCRRKRRAPAGTGSA